MILNSSFFENFDCAQGDHRANWEACSYSFSCVCMCACESMWVCMWRPKINTGSLPPLFSALFTQARSQCSPQFDGQLASESPPVSAPCLGLQPGLHANSEFARVLGIQTNDTHTCVWPALLHWHISGSWEANGGVFSRSPRSYTTCSSHSARWKPSTPSTCLRASRTSSWWELAGCSLASSWDL